MKLSRVQATNPIIRKHGNEYRENEQDGITGDYPFELCPECMGTDTVVDMGHDNPYPITGDYHYTTKGITVTKLIRVNYICNSCGCKWTSEYEDKKNGLRQDVDKAVAFRIIAALIFTLSIFTSYSLHIISQMYPENEIPGTVEVMMVISAVITGCGIAYFTLLILCVVLSKFMD